MNIEIIAELAQGFEGRKDQAKLLLKAAASSGADSAKLQLVYADELATPDYKHYALFKALEMSDGAWRELAAYAHDLGIKLHLDVFGVRSLELAEQVGIDTLMLHATDIDNEGMLLRVAQSTLPRVILGCGGAFLPEIEKAVNTLGNKKIILMFGFQGYPTPIDGNNISRIEFFATKFSVQKNITIGFADHSLPNSDLHLTLSAMALGFGARIFEKHLTLGEVMKLEDFEAAVNPDRFCEFVKNLRLCASAYGTTSNSMDFNMSESELGYRKFARRHVVTRTHLPKGKCLEPEDLVLKRTSSESALTSLVDAYGAYLKCDLEANTPLTKLFLG